VSAPLEGTIERLRLKAGDPVERGMLLATIHPNVPALLDARTEQELRERLRAAEATKEGSRAAVGRAHAALAQAKADYERTRRLAESELVPPARRERDELAVTLATKDFQTAQFEDQAAEHQVEMARAALLRVQKRPQTHNGVAHHWEIYSPVLGRVLRVFQESEGVVTLGAPLLELADPSDLEVTKTSALGIEEQRVNVVIDVRSQREQWKSIGDGYHVEARIVVFHAGDVVQVPIGALFRDGEAWAAFVVSDGRARKRVIHVGGRGGTTALIEKGVEPGEHVVVYPSDAVRDGVRVVVR
jgi:HlyD family secretion protein